MKKIILATVLFVALLIPLSSKADGGVMPHPGYWISESDQKAIIAFENNTETLVLSTTFRGDAQDFSWIIPTPSQPSVNKGTYGIFEALQELTNVSSGNGYNYGSALDLAAPTAKQEVTVLEQKKIDVYDISVLEATNKDALYNWLKDNNYNYPEYGKTILDDYIQNGWFFTAVKINAEDSTLAENRLRSGTITPLKLTFSSDKIVYPLKISSITMNEPTVSVPPSYPVADTEPGAEAQKEVQAMPIIPSNYMGVQIYIFADHKKQIDGFNKEYANWVDAKTIKNLALDDSGNAWYSPSGKEMYLTSLYRNMNTQDMRNDLFPVDADNNKTNPPSQFWMNVFLVVLIILGAIISPLGLLYVILMLLFIFLKSKVAKVFFLIIQGLFGLFGITAAILLSISLSEGSAGNEGVLPALIAALIITVAMIVGIILEIVLGKRKGLL